MQDNLQTLHLAHNHIFDIVCPWKFLFYHDPIQHFHTNKFTFFGCKHHNRITTQIEPIQTNIMEKKWFSLNCFILIPTKIENKE